MALTATEEAQARQLIAQQAALLSLAGNEATITSKLGAAKVNLGQLPAASALADADLLLTRQGVNDRSLTASLLAQYISAELGVTAPQFDNDTSLATTAFVQRASGNLRTLGSSNVSAAMAASHMGGLYAFYGSNAGQTVTLPASAAFITGTSVWFVNQSNKDVTLAGNGTDIISANNIGTGQTTGATLVVSAGDSIMLSYDGGGQWNSWAYTSAKQFPNLLVGNGYQRLPNGLLIQWGIATTNASGLANFTFPITFPNFVFRVLLTASGTNSVATLGTVTNSTAGVNCFTGSTGVGKAENVQLVAIGY